MNELRAIRTLARVVELGSIRRAAEVQGVTPQAASQALAQLEQRVGVRLLHRTTRSLSLTEDGRRLLESTQPALQALDHALDGARTARDTMAGPLRIVGPRSGFAPLLMPVLSAYCAQHPEVQPEVLLDDGIGNWVADRVDVGFRMGNPPGDGLVARRLMPIQLLVVASPAYLERHGAPASIDALAQHRCSVFRHPSTGVALPWMLEVDGTVVERHVPASLSTNDTEVELQAVLDGQVLAQVASFSAMRHLRSGALVPVLNAHLSDHLGVWLYFGTRRAQPRRVRAFIDLAVTQLTDNPDFMLSARELAALRPRKAARARR